MKRTLLLLAFLSCIFAACQHSDKKKNNLLNKDKLLSQFFSVNTNKDTTLFTANGAFISIPQGALSGNGSETVQLEIKEAYSMEQIILAGLTTQSNGQPLSSGGMIYINAVGGQSIKISKTIAVKIPTPSLDKRMQLYKGDTDANGNINWIQPHGLPDNPQSSVFEGGKQLFLNNCASCHTINKESTGPALAHILARTNDKKLLYDYTRNNFKVISEGNQYYRCLYEKYNKTAMNTFTALTDQDLDGLYGYIENESKVRNLPIPKNEITPCTDSCNIYLKIKDKLTHQLNSQKVDMVIESIINPPLVATAINEPIDTTIMNSPIPSGKPTVVTRVAPGYNQSLYYQFKIEAFGWHNIDCLLNTGNMEESILTVRLIGKYTQNINLYLVLPAAKVFVQGGLLNNKTDQYGFFSDDGKINLPQNIKGKILALGEFEDKIIFVQKEFTTATQQNFEMEPLIITKEFFNAAIKKSGFPADLDISVNSINNADSLKKIIKNLKDVEKIKPRKCDCNCGMQNNAPVEQIVPAVDTSRKV